MTSRSWHQFAAACATGIALTACTSANPSLPNDSKPVVADPLSRARVHTELAALYYQQGSMKTALDELATAVKIDPQYAPAYSMLGLVYMQLGETGPADHNFQKAIALAPNDPDIRNNYGLFLCDTRQYQKGLAQLDAALSNPLYNTPWRALDNAARCAQDMGDTALASRYRQQAARYGVAAETSSQKLQ
jgi:type IV pilus assembly protein PilF